MRQASSWEGVGREGRAGPREGIRLASVGKERSAPASQGMFSFIVSVQWSVVFLQGVGEGGASQPPPLAPSTQWAANWEAGNNPEASAPKFMATNGWSSPGFELPVPSPGMVTGARDRHARSTGVQSSSGSGGSRSHSLGVDTLCGEAHKVSGASSPALVLWL